MRTHFTVIRADGERCCGHRHKSIDKAIICANKLVWPKGRLLDFNNEWLRCCVYQIIQFYTGGYKQQCVWTHEVKTMSADEFQTTPANAFSTATGVDGMKDLLESLKPKPVQGEKCSNCRYCYPSLITIDRELKGASVCTHPRIKKVTGGMGSSLVIENPKEVGCEKWKKVEE